MGEVSSSRHTIRWPSFAAPALLLPLALRKRCAKLVVPRVLPDTKPAHVNS